MNKVLGFMLFFLVGISFVGYFIYRTEKKSDARLRIVCTTNIIADTVSHLVDDNVEIYSLMGPGVDPHLYRAKESDVARLLQADLIFYNGLHLEGKMAEVFEKMNAYTTVVAVIEGIAKDQLFFSEFAEVYDPHVWHDVALWEQAVNRIKKALITRDPEYKQLYQKKSQEYQKQLQLLDNEISAQTQKLKKEQRVLVTAHDAFFYFGKRYDFEVVGLQGISTDSDISTKDIQQLANMIVEKKVPAIFIESSIPHRTIQAVQKAVESRGWNVTIGAELFSDALDAPGTKAGTYVGMIQSNVESIVSALSIP